MRSEVHKGHQHHQHSRHHHKKRKHRHENPANNSVVEDSPVPVIPSESSGSESKFPLSKEQTVSRDRRSGRSGEYYQSSNHNVTDHGVPVVISSDSEANEAYQELLAAKRRKKQKHKERKKQRPNESKHQQEQQSDNRETQFNVKVKQEPVESDSDRSPVMQVQEFRTVRLKQEPVDSDEENSRRHRINNHRSRRSSQERNGDSNSNHRHFGESNGRQRSPPRVAVKREAHDSYDRAEQPHDSHGHKASRRGRPTANDRKRDNRERRDGRSGEGSQEVRNGRGQTSQSRDGGQRRNRDHDRRSGEREAPQRREVKRERPSDEDEGQFEWGRADANRPQGSSNGAEKPAEKQKPNFGLSGKLTEDTNTFNGVVIKYSEPPEARKPKRRWRFYPFKGEEGLPTLYLHRQSAYLIGRDRKVADIPVDHPSCSKQHAAFQYRLVAFTREDGSKGKRIRPYIIDLDSANGTFVNNQRIEPRKYVELLERDVVKFGYSSRDYVLLHEQSKDDEEDDDNNG